MKKARKVIAFLNLFPQVPGRVWIDIWLVAALIKFVMNWPINIAALSLVLGTYAVSNVAKKYIENTDQTDA